MNSYSIAIHGGAGTISKNSMTPEKELAYKNGLQDAIEAGESILKNGGTAFDAVESAIIQLENNPLFNAGKGAVFTHNGLHELDASIMNGVDLTAGAVAGVQHIKNPISLARAVMEQSEHVLLTGNGAMEFAKKVNARFENDDYFFVQLRYDQLQLAKQTDSMVLDHTENLKEKSEKKFGTVGCVALDQKGNLAAGTSTGGMTNKKYGRVGDSSIIGSGTYANNKTCAVSCTGHGELFMRSVVAYDISCLMEYKNLSLKEACDLVVMDKLVKIGGEGGLIALDSKGHVALPFNSDGMYRASKKENEELFIGIYK
ncbi:MAG: isoaspartyl peptidase [Bacteroidetes bacterium]|jgi:beta-aspartyl-peptidase (threonine type)|nr:isoaspartyl peptidase [Bacteroidota bacterium]